MLAIVKQTQGTRPSPKRRARAYRYRLDDLWSWQTYIGPVRNQKEATRALKDMFGDRLAEVRVHPVCDPWPKARENRLARGAHGAAS